MDYTPYMKDIVDSTDYIKKKTSIPEVSTQPVPPPPAPYYPPRYVNNSINNVKVAPSDIIQFNDSLVDVALMQDLLFEDIAAVELANISRSDLIDGQDVVYSPIKNLSTVWREFNPNNLIVTAASNEYFTRFGIDLASKTIYDPYFDYSGNLVIEMDGVTDDEEIQVQILSDGTINLIGET